MAASKPVGPPAKTPEDYVRIALAREEEARAALEALGVKCVRPQPTIAALPAPAAAPSFATEDSRGRTLAPAERLRHLLSLPPAAVRLSSAEALEPEITQHGRVLAPVERLRHEAPLDSLAAAASPPAAVGAPALAAAAASAEAAAAAAPSASAAASEGAPPPLCFDHGFALMRLEHHPDLALPRLCCVGRKQAPPPATIHPPR